jgi:alpha-mannosidase II
MAGGVSWPEPVTEQNVKRLSKVLLDQYRKKSQLYGDGENHNVLLVPLGNDFTYKNMLEAHNQFENYEKLMIYMNSDKKMNVNVKFGTLGEYFQLVKKRNEDKEVKVKTFSGDFFTYADEMDHYWSGYFTSRVFTKRLDRLVEHYLRSAEILFSLSNLIQKQTKNVFVVANQLYKRILVARRNLALFQHHDGITGTAKSEVVQDYSNKLKQFPEFSIFNLNF